MSENNTSNTLQCTYTESKRSYISQYYYRCEDCCLSKGQGICIVCAIKCHNGHKIVEEPTYGKFFCDCGDGSLKIKCQCLEKK